MSARWIGGRHEISHRWVVVGVASAGPKKEARSAGRGLRWVVRCAWCERYRAGDGWIDLKAFEAFTETTRVTHGICNDCVARLEAERRDRP